MLPHIVSLLVILPLLAMLCWKDCTSRTLPNRLTFALALAGAVLRFVFDGVGGVADGLAGAIIGGLFLLIPFLLKSAGGGDLKMLFAAGIITGVRFCVAQLLFVSVSGLVLALVMLVTGRVKRRGAVPFGIAIAVGTLLTLVYRAYVEC